MEDTNYPTETNRKPITTSSRRQYDFNLLGATADNKNITKQQMPPIGLIILSPLGTSNLTTSNQQ